MTKDNYIKGSTLCIVDDNFNSLECYVAYSNNQFAIVILEGHEKDLSADLFFSFQQIKELVPDFIEERLLEENEHYLIVGVDRACTYNYRELYCKINNVPSLDVGCNFPTRQLGYLIDSTLVYKGADSLAVLKVYDGEDFDVMMEVGYDKDDFLLLYSDFHDEVEIDSSRFYYLLVDMNSGVIIDLYSYLSYLEEAISPINPDYEKVDEDGTIRIHKTLYDDIDSSGD